jgi:hypothetical protein
MEITFHERHVGNRFAVRKRTAQKIVRTGTLDGWESAAQERRGDSDFTFPRTASAGTTIREGESLAEWARPSQTEEGET